MVCTAVFKHGLGQVMCRLSESGILSMSVEAGMNAGSVGYLVFV